MTKLKKSPGLMRRICCAAGLAAAGALAAAAAADGQNFGEAKPEAAVSHTQRGALSYAVAGGTIQLSFAAADWPAAADGGAKARAGKAPPARLFGLIAMDLKPGWKTYWRNPGTSGLVPKIELDGGAKAEILFPAPQRLTEQGEQLNGYQNRVRLPFRIILPHSARPSYSGSLFIGICSSQCMPQKIPFQFRADPLPDTALLRQIRAALQALPQPPSKNFAIIRAQAVKDRVDLVLRYPGRQSGAPQLFLDGGDLQIGQAAPQNGVKTGKAGGNTQIYSAPLLFGAANDGAPIAYTAVLPQGQAVSGVIKLRAAKPKS